MSNIIEGITKELRKWLKITDAQLLCGHRPEGLDFKNTEKIGH